MHWDEVMVIPGGFVRRRAGVQLLGRLSMCGGRQGERGGNDLHLADRGGCILPTRP